jgi:hypothetical protein
MFAKIWDRRREVEPMVELLSREELDYAVMVSVKAAGFSVEELERQATCGSFESHRARLAWDLVKGARRLRAS